MNKRIDPETKEEILKRRAALLSTKIEKQRDISEAMHVLQFKLGQETYAIDTQFVSEVYEVAEITPLPGLPTFAKGVFNLRGKILTALDLHELFEVPKIEDRDLSTLIILKDHSIEFGIYTVEALDTRYIFPDEFEKTFAGLSDFTRDKVSGITKDNLIVIDAKQLINDDIILFN